ncbi:MAG TPA: TonB-dependent receptor plug domain-containing protein [Fibrobacteria bacterium]|nr:TonB-dependent receptor plug domain-containing protein [Fibrobacteria bacterium]
MDNSRHRPRTLPALFALGSALACPAAEPAGDSSRVLPLVEVSAPSLAGSRNTDARPRTWSQPRSEESGTEILGREEIRSLQPRDAIDLLDKATGLNVTYQGRRSPFFVDERGGGSMTFVLDGAILPSQSNRILQNIPVEAIEEIRIVRGATSLSMGSGIPSGSSASGSALNTGFVVITTRRARAVEAKVSSWWEKSPSQPYANGQGVWVGSPLGDSLGWKGHAGAMVSRSDRPSKDSWFDGRTANSVLATAGVQYGIVHLEGTAYMDSGRFEMQRGLTLADTLDPSKWYYDPLVTTVLGLSGGIQWSKGQSTSICAYWTKFEQHEVNQSFANPSSTTRDFWEKNVGASVRHDAILGGTLFQAGFQTSTSSAFGPNTNNPFNDWETSVTGGSIAASRPFLEDRLHADIGWRRDIKHIDHTATSQGKLAVDKDIDLPAADLLAAGTSWRSGMWVADARGSLGWTGSAEDLDLRTKDGSPMDPEAQQRAEVTVGATPFPWLHPSATLFWVHFQNQKTATADTFSVAGQTCYFYTQSDSRRNGLELRWQGEWSRLVSWDASWTHLLVDETWTSGTTADAIGTAQPGNILTGRVSAVRDGWKATLSAKAVDTYDQSTSAMGTASNVHLGDYLRIDASLSKTVDPFDRFLSMEIYARNLANDRYSTRYTTGYYRDRGLTVGTLLTAGL